MYGKIDGSEFKSALLFISLSITLSLKSIEEVLTFKSASSKDVSEKEC